MGVDVQLLAFNVSDDDVARIEKIPNVWAVRSYGDGNLWIEGVMPYYSPFYRRGDWPAIRELLVAVREVAPNVRYGSIGDEEELLNNDGMVVTDALLARLDADWASLPRSRA